MKPLLLAAALLAALPGAARAEGPQTIQVHVTYYGYTGSPTYSGEMPYDGSAGCSFDIPLNTVLQFRDGRIVRCNDRGMDAFMAPHVDVYCSGSVSYCTDSVLGAGNWTIPEPVTVLAWGGQ